MADTNFVDGTTVVVAEWLNDVNQSVYDAIGNGTVAPNTPAEVRANINVPTRTGGDASGTWGINISGNAATATLATLATTATTAVNQAGGTVSATSFNGGQLAGTRNKIINGSHFINQRGVSGTVVLAAGVYGHDRWKAGASGCTYTFATTANVITLTITAGSLIQVVEGLNLQTGTYILSWTGTSQGKIGAGSFGASGITGSITGGTNTNIEFNTGTLSLVQLELGTVATPFEYRFYGLELSLCQRYYQTATIYIPDAGSLPTNWLFKVSMRANPTITGGGAGYITIFVNSEAVAHRQTTANGQSLAALAEL